MNFTSATNNKINAAIKKKISQQLLNAKNKAEQLKQQFLLEFSNHPITTEIKLGPDASNISGTLSGRDGNLFTFIGFEKGDEPTDKILELIQQIQITTYGDYLIIKIPTPEDVWQVTPIPFQDGRSWAKGIESGISGLNYYLYLKKESESSRSGLGLQSANKIVSNTRYVPTQYMSTMLKKYKTKFSSLLNRNKNLFISIE